MASRPEFPLCRAEADPDDGSAWRQGGAWFPAPPVCGSVAAAPSRIILPEGARSMRGKKRKKLVKFP